MSKRAADLGVRELVPGCDEHSGFDARAREQHFLYELAAVKSPHGQQRNGQKGRPPECLAEGLGELGVGRRRRGAQIDRAPHVVGGQDEADGIDLVSQRDPREILLSGPESPAEAELERQ